MSDTHPPAPESVHPRHEHVLSRGMPHDRGHTYRHCLRWRCGYMETQEARA